MIIDVRKEGTELLDGIFVLRRFFEGHDYRDPGKNRLISSVGRNLWDGRIVASIDSRFTNDPNYECLYSR